MNRWIRDARCIEPTVPAGPPKPRARRLGGGARGVRVLLVALLLGACAHTAEPTLDFTRPIVLLGEVHDNAAQHALRLQAFERWVARGARPALVMEQFDRDRQPAIDTLRQRPGLDAETLVREAGRPGWPWPLLVPYVDVALRHGLPIVAANVPRDEARRVMREGLAATGFDADVPPRVLDAQARDIEASHCGTLDAATARRMALAQVARDQAMAAAVERHGERGVLLLAGNGHVRRDLGVPRWLSPATRARSESIGLLETGDEDDAGAFDRSLVTPRQRREDPCAELRR